MKKLYNIKIAIYFSFIIFLIIGFSIYDDYGISIDEKFHRNNELFWYTYSKNALRDFVISIFSSTEIFTYENLSIYIWLLIFYFQYRKKVILKYFFSILFFYYENLGC